MQAEARYDVEMKGNLGHSITVSVTADSKGQAELLAVRMFPKLSATGNTRLKKG